MTHKKRTRKRAALKRCQQQYDALKSDIAELRYVMQGSVVTRTKRCGQPSCHCHLSPEYEHGPYHQWTRKIEGKTVTRSLSAEEARVFRSCIQNGRRLRKLVARMFKTSERAARLLAQESERTK